MNVTARLRNVVTWVSLLLIGPPVWCVIGLLPTARARWRLVQGAGRLIRLVAGVELQVIGEVPGDEPFVVVANHDSFIDAMVLICAVSEPLVFVAGATLERQRVAGPFLRRLGCVFVGGQSGERASSVIVRLTAVLDEGRSLAVFPEGSLARNEGLRRFRTGAFAVAATAGRPVVPVALSGTRSIVRPGGRTARSGRVRVSIGAPIRPSGDDPSAVVALRTSSYQSVAALLEALGAERTDSLLNEGSPHAR